MKSPTKDNALVHGLRPAGAAAAPPGLKAVANLFSPRRAWLILLVVAAVLVLGGGAALAQGEVVYSPITSAGWRGPGNYLSWPKMLVCWLIFLCWVATTDWASRDLQRVRSLDYILWNPILVGTFFLAFVASWVIPSFWIALPVLLLAYLVPLAIFIVQRNAVVDPHHRVLTRDHLRYLFATLMNRVGVKMAVERPDPDESGPPVMLKATGGPTETDEKVRLALAKQTKGLRPAREIIAGGLVCRATSIMLDYTQQSVAVRYMVDGLWLPREPEPREKADPALESLKVLCGLNPQDRRNRQEGDFAAVFNGRKLLGALACQGTKTGERVVIQMEETSTKFTDLESLGMRDKMQEQLRELLESRRGMFFFSAMPANGLRTTTYVGLKAMDRLMRDFLGLEDAENRYEPVENIPIEVYQVDQGPAPAEMLPRLLRKEPDVVVVRDIPDAATLSILCRASVKEKLVVSTMRSKDCAEALLQVLAIGAPAQEVSAVALGVLNQRLVRKLCTACKEPYQPTNEVLQHLGIPPGRIAAFYRPPTQPTDKPCPECGGIGYCGRTAIFELLIVGDTVRKVLSAAAPRVDTLRSAARRDGMRTMQEEGLLLVAKGVTSLPELMRVMKQ